MRLGGRKRGSYMHGPVDGGLPRGPEVWGWRGGFGGLLILGAQVEGLLELDF